MSSSCKICGKSRSPYIMNNKTVCLKCDELLFDIEIECDEENRLSDEKVKGATLPQKRVLHIAKK